MIPSIESYYFYLYRDFRNGENPLNLLQLIAHTKKFVEDENISEEEFEEIQKNKKLCEPEKKKTVCDNCGDVQLLF